MFETLRQLWTLLLLDYRSVDHTSLRWGLTLNIHQQLIWSHTWDFLSLSCCLPDKAQFRQRAIFLVTRVTGDKWLPLKYTIIVAWKRATVTMPFSTRSTLNAHKDGALWKMHWVRQPHDAAWPVFSLGTIKKKKRDTCWHQSKHPMIKLHKNAVTFITPKHSCGEQKCSPRSPLQVNVVHETSYPNRKKEKRSDPSPCLDTLLLCSEHAWL